MGKNIIICSDGTGQRGGLFVDERRSNIYKLYSACRCGPDSSINPAEQLAYYDPGIGTLPAGLGFLGAIERKIHNWVSQATGLGLTTNIVDCYAAIVSLWQPGDRIFLLGFSRGAYTVRCVAAVLALCGIPVRMKDGGPLKRDASSIRKIAKEAVKRVYQHVSSPRDAKYISQRTALAERFRQEYGSDVSDKSNAFPHFIGVFDTVASIASYGSLAFVAILTLGLITIVSSALWFFFHSFLFWFGYLTALAIVVAVTAYLVTHIKVAFGLKSYRWWQTFHVTEARMKFYDTQLNQNVGWARHALAIDEHRADFNRVPWGSQKTLRKTLPDEPDWLEQIWFAGNHSDIGGSYPENESRLSDTTLQWMVDAAEKIPGGLKIDQSRLRLYPSAAGMQHDECRELVFRLVKKINRSIDVDAILHPSVHDRFKLPAVLQYDLMLPYRPANLRRHEKLSQYY